MLCHCKPIRNLIVHEQSKFILIKQVDLKLGNSHCQGEVPAGISRGILARVTGGIQVGISKGVQRESVEKISVGIQKNFKLKFIEESNQESEENPGEILAGIIRRITDAIPRQILGKIPKENF